ncbi:MAG TPA: aldo/keto reductase [Chloroflexi bacterium]|jgi:aryl-alcohol dehydrogenase-like predicted oxidoreductase|nr:aldo/keto reductase [Chloroflexota bacterium]
METRTFGDSDLRCSALGFGTWEMGTTEYGAIDVDEACRAVREAIDRGITLFDTAEAYGPYHSEELLCRALGPRRKDVVIVTKVGFNINAEPRVVGRCSKRDYIIARAEGCLRRLGTDWIDLLLIHWPDHDTPYEEPIEALENLKAAGKIRHYGVSNFSPAMMHVCERVGHLTANQMGYHMFDRRAERAVLPYCQDHGIGFMAYGTLAFGLLSGAFTPATTFVDWDWRSRGYAFDLPLFRKDMFERELRVVERLKELAARYDKSVAQLAIAWVLGHPAVTVALVGMRNPRELDENVAAADWRLTPEDRAEIDRIMEEEGVPTHVNSAQAL